VAGSGERTLDALARAARPLGRLRGRRLACLPLGERGLIALQSIIIKIEDAGIAAAMAAIVEFRPPGRRWGWVVTQGVLRRVPQGFFPRGLRHGCIRVRWVSQYKLIWQRACGPRLPLRSPAPDERHLARHDRHELHIGR
jgi:hypothetical protein